MADSSGVDRPERPPLRKRVIFGWIVYLAGTTLWLYGYLVGGRPSLIDWHAYTPWWIADFLPNLPAESGMALIFAGTILTFRHPSDKT
jgi:hypothetical protein